MTPVVLTDAMVQKAFARTAAQERPVGSERFKPGDMVVYSAHGVGRIDSIGLETIGGHTLEIIQVSFLENRMTVRVPTAKAQSAGLRKLSTPDLLAKAIAVLGGKPRVSKLMWAKRAQDYQGRINSGAPIALAELLRDLRRNTTDTQASYSERNVYEAALDRLASEIAAVGAVDKAAAVAKVTDALTAAASADRSDAEPAALP